MHPPHVGWQSSPKRFPERISKREPVVDGSVEKPEEPGNGEDTGVRGIL
jgi:hypothetical protein